MPISVPAGAIRHTGGCLQPVLLRGRADYIDSGTGELIHRYTTVHEPGGVLPIACKTRRASRCPPCAEVYRTDTYQLIHAGLTGGKGIPATVADHPCVFVTLTAPSFGPVHARREKDGRVLACRPRRKDKTCPHGIRLSCSEKHAREDDRLGEPLCPDCYGRRPYVPAAEGRSAMPRLLLTVPEAAETLAISRSKLYELLASGAIASIRIDGSRRIPVTALEEYVSRLLAERTAA